MGVVDLCVEKLRGGRLSLSNDTIFVSTLAFIANLRRQRGRALLVLSLQAEGKERPIWGARGVPLTERL